MATEYAAPFAGTTIATSQQFRDRNKMLGPDGIDADPTTTAGAVTDGGAGASINVQNFSAMLQGSMYQLTAGPLNLPVAANGGGSNRFDRVVLTYDASHSPGIYTRIVQGTPGAGLPALTFNASGVWDMPLAHYEKTPAGAITGIVDCRRFLDPGWNGQVISNASVSTDHVFPPGSARRGQRLMYWSTKEVWGYDGAVWFFQEPGSVCPPVQSFSETDQNPTSATFAAGSPVVEVTFIAPPSGKVFVSVMGATEANTSANSGHVSFEIRLTNAAGAIFLAADDARGQGTQGAEWSQAGDEYLVTGLSPRVQYYARAMHRSFVGGQDATIFRRRIMVKPSLP